MRGSDCGGPVFQSPTTQHSRACAQVCTASAQNRGSLTVPSLPQTTSTPEASTLSFKSYYLMFTLISLNEKYLEMLLFKKCYYLYREGEGDREKHQSVASCTPPSWGLNLQPMHVL